MFVKQSNQFLYGAVTLVVLIVLAVGLITVFRKANQTATGPGPQTLAPTEAAHVAPSDKLPQNPTPVVAVAESTTSSQDTAEMEVISGYMELDGSKLYYEMMGSGPPLVLLHDAILHREVWDGQFAVLAREYTVIRYDRRGYGLSETDKPGYVNIEDLHALLQFLELDSVTLIGSSYGGEMAIDFALTYPEMVDALVLVGAPISGVSFPNNDLYSVVWRNTVFDRYFGNFRPSGRLYNTDEAKEAINQWMDFPNSRYWIMPEHADVWEQARSLLLVNLQNLTHPRLLKGPDQLADGRLPEIQVPTLIIVGESDSTDLHEHADKLEADIAGAEKVVIPNAAHLVHLEQPEVFNQVVLDFLRRQ
jgi:3-oxoadipate enol-lactonase